MIKIRFFDPADEPQPKKITYRLTNWSDYNQALIQRGRLTLWLDEDTIANWYYKGPNGPGGLYRYSDACIECALSLKSVLKLAFRQTQGLIQSLIESMKLPLTVPSYSQLCRRQARLVCSLKPSEPVSDAGKALHILVDSTGLKVYGEGEWKVRKHGASKRRTWRKLHLAQDEATGELEAVELTTNAATDAETVKPLLAQIARPIGQLGGDGAYDQVQVYNALEARQIQPVIPPRSNAVIWTDESGEDLIHPRNEAIKLIDEVGLASWKQQSGYHRRSLVETGMFRWKTLFGERLQSRLLVNQQVEVRVKAACLNRFTRLGMPKTVIKNST